MLLELNFVCAHCGQVNESTVDPSQGESQCYVEDCQICCRPLVLRVSVNDRVAQAEVSPESE